MSTVCDKLKERLLDGETLSDAESLAHLRECPECLELQANLTQLDSLFAELPEIEPESAVTERVLGQLQSVRTSPKETAPRQPIWKKQTLLGAAVLITAFLLTKTGRFTVANALIEGSFGAIVLLVAVVGMAMVLPASLFSPSRERRRFRAASVGFATLGLATFAMRSNVSPIIPNSTPAPIENQAYEDLLEYTKDDAKSTAAAVRERANQINELSKQKNAGQPAGVVSGIVNRMEGLDEALKKVDSAAKSSSTNERDDKDSLEARTSVDGETNKPVITKSDSDALNEKYAGMKKEYGGYRKPPALFGASELDNDRQREATRGAQTTSDKVAELRSRRVAGIFQAFGGPATSTAPSGEPKTPVNALQATNSEKPNYKLGAELAEPAGNAQSVPPNPPVIHPGTSNKWDEFLRQRADTKNLTFQNPVGYWENTYLPGNPMQRALELSIERTLKNVPVDLSELLHSIVTLAEKPIQPFDAPATGALGVQLNADTRSINGEQRILIQIGIRGADRLNASRQAIREVVVADLRNKLTNASAEKMKALLLSLDQNKENRDRITVIFVTPAGLHVIEPKDFRYGTLTTELSELLSSSASNSGKTLTPALIEAVKRLSTELSPETAFSAPGVLLISSEQLNGELEQLSSTAYRASLEGIPLTVFATGDAPNLENINTLAIAGRGRAKAITTLDEVGRTVRDELASVGRTVAQAVRLNLKLQPGVKLVEVIDSKRLSEQSVKEVKAGEKAVDERLSAALSIPMDRGEDGDGIQIIIPAFYGGDSHVVLVDVVAPGPGAIASLTAQFKDLVQLENKKIQVGLSLENGERQLGRSEYSVIQNYLSLHLDEKLKSAADALRHGNIGEAAQILQNELELFESVQRSAAELQHTSDSRSEIELLKKGLAALKSSSRESSVELAEVFEYVSLRRTNIDTVL